MSNVIKGVKKVFKKVTKVVKKIAPYAIAAAAIYFTAGVALSAMPATSAFAAGLPGFAGAGGAGTGILSKVAAKVGLGALGKAGGLAAAAGGGIAPAIGMGVGFMPTAGGAVAGGAMKAAGMSLTEKLMLASVGTNALGALLAPSPREVAEAEYSEAKKWRGSFYGMETGGTPAEVPQPSNDSLFPERPRTPTAPPPAKPTLAEQFSAPKLAANTMNAQQPAEFDLFRGFGNG